MVGERTPAMRRGDSKPSSANLHTENTGLLPSRKRMIGRHGALLLFPSEITTVFILVSMEL